MRQLGACSAPVSVARAPQCGAETLAAHDTVPRVDLRGAIGFSSFGVLLYYLTANTAAYTQTAPHRRFPKVLQILGAAGCLLLVATLPWQAVLGGVLVFAVGIAYRALRTRPTRR